MRDLQSTYVKGSRKWTLVGQGAIEINEAIRLIEQVHDLPLRDKDSATPCREPDLQDEIAILRKGLEDIIQHQEIIGGQLAKGSATVFIARKALTESKDALE